MLDVFDDILFLLLLGLRIGGDLCLFFVIILGDDIFFNMGFWIFFIVKCCVGILDEGIVVCIIFIGNWLFKVLLFCVGVLLFFCGFLFVGLVIIKCGFFFI